MSGVLQDILDKLKEMPAEKRKQLEKEVMAATGHMKWVPNPGPQSQAYFSQADELFYGGQAGGGKLLPLTEILPTPHGWVAMGDIVVGQQIFDEQGMLCRVTGLSEIETPKTYRLAFDDGTTITAGADHRWLTYDAKELADCLTKTPEWRAKRQAKRASRAKGNKSAAFVASIALRNSSRRYDVLAAPVGSIRTTQQIADTLLTKRGRRNHAVPVARPLHLPHRDLPVDPYVLGAWLGDGSKASGSFAGIDSEIWGEIKAAGFAVTHAADGKAHYIRGLKVLLRSLGVLGNKHVPQEYLRSSYDQRLSLLQGLMDTDGHAALDGGCEFDNTNRALIDAVYEILMSLGIKATIQEGRAKLNGVIIGPKWRVKFTTSLPVFRLPRKLARLNEKTRQTSRFRYIVASDEVPGVPMRCISVDSPSRLYLAGRSMVPTHNSDLMIGLSLNEHKRSLILRRTNKEASKIVERYVEIIGNRVGFNGQDNVWRLPDGRIIDMGGVQHEDDKQKYKGTPHDLIAFDEVSDFTESQYLFITIWNRAADPGQRCRVVAAGNPPTRPEGLWVIKRWAAWLDPKHPRPAKPGELRWYLQMVDGGEVEVDGPGPHWNGAENVRAKSRTFIPAKLADNPDLAATNYDATLAALPEALRLAYREGRFDVAIKDDLWQVIPSAWIYAAQKRWTPQPPTGVPMCCIAADIAQGGEDSTTLAMRFDWWYAPLLSVPGKATPDGTSVAGLIVANRRDKAEVVLDMGGGWGGAAFERLRDNGIEVTKYVGAEASVKRTVDKQIGFYNRRAEAYWRFREALDPSQPNGSPIALPDDPELVADLTAPLYKMTPRGFQITPKEDLVDKLGRSPDKGDAVIMAWFGGLRGYDQMQQWSQDQGTRRRIGGMSGRSPRVIMDKPRR